jgi:class 3 adenylate cyclase
VTFLFTDIEDSTRLWDQHPGQMREALARHDALIETLVARSGGHVVRPRGEGDSRFAVFEHPLNAVVAAIAIQRALRAEPWPLRVHMGVHTGQADSAEGDYYGSDVNRCARLRGLAHGGQTLLSEKTVSLVGSCLPTDASVISLGNYSLKGLAKSEHVFQLNASGLPDKFPPLDAGGDDLALARRDLVARAASQILSADARPTWMRGLVAAVACLYLVTLVLGWWTIARHGSPAFILAPSSDGVIITGVWPNGPADQAGLGAGDSGLPSGPSLPSGTTLALHFSASSMIEGK